MSLSKEVSPSRAMTISPEASASPWFRLETRPPRCSLGTISRRRSFLALTYDNARKLRRLEIVPKLQRGGRVSSLNQGLALASGEIVMALDGDTSFDNDMVRHAVRHFADQNVVAVSGNLRARNARSSFVTRLQALEYALSIHLSRAGLDAFNLVNNISG